MSNILIVTILLFLGIIAYKSKTLIKVLNRFIYYYIYYNYVSDTFEQIKKIAYMKIFNENVILELTNNSKLDSKQISFFSKEYIKLLYLFSGDMINDIIILYGNSENMIAHLTSEFVTKIIYDQIDKFSKENETEIPDIMGNV